MAIQPLNTFPAEWEPQIAKSNLVGDGTVTSSIFGDDGRLNVQFMEMPEIDEGETLRVGHKVIKKYEYVRIQRVGDKNQIYFQRAYPRHIRRFPKQYEAFKAGKATGNLGIPLKAWEYQLGMTELATLSLLGIEYVHQLAAVSDSALASMGHGGHELRARAQITVKDLQSKEAQTSMQMELNARDQDIAKLREEMEQMKKLWGAKKEVEEKNIAAFEKQIGLPPPAGPGRGRPKKIITETEGTNG